MLLSEIFFITLYFYIQHAYIIFDIESIIFIKMQNIRKLIKLGHLLFVLVFRIAYVKNKDNALHQYLPVLLF